MLTSLAMQAVSFVFYLGPIWAGAMGLGLVQALPFVILFGTWGVIGKRRTIGTLMMRGLGLSGLVFALFIIGRGIAGVSGYAGVWVPSYPFAFSAFALAGLGLLRMRQIEASFPGADLELEQGHARR